MNLLEQLFQWQHDLTHLEAEITLVVGAIMVLVVGLFNPPKWIIKITTAIALLATLYHLNDGGHELFEGFIEPSRLALLTTDLVVLSCLVLLIFPVRSEQKSSYYFILLTILLGVVLMMQAQHLLLIYLALELVSYGSYILTNMSFTRHGHEAGLKYLLFGGVTSAIMLFGISILYGTSGGLLLSDLMVESPYQILGMCMFLAGIFFKISAVPFHIWVPNVYQSAPVDTAVFFSIVPKLGGLVLLHNLLKSTEWGQDIIMTIGILTILIGTLGALRQTNFRRLLSYGAIAHSGFLIPLAILDIDSGLFFWYAAVYVMMNLGIFYSAKIMEDAGVEAVSDYDGLGKEMPILGIGMVLILIALIGLPPTAGFTAKWLLFGVLWSEYQLSADPLIIGYLIVSVFATVLALFYYLRVPYYMFLKGGANEKHIRSKYQGAIVLFGILLLILFFVPDMLTLFA